MGHYIQATGKVLGFIAFFAGWQVLGYALSLTLTSDMITLTAVSLAITTVAVLGLSKYLYEHTFWQLFSYRLSVPTVAKTFGLWLIFVLVSELAGHYWQQTPMDFMQDIALDNRSWVLWLAVVVLAPICEELVFRQLIFETLAKFGQVVAVLGSSLLFAGVHWQYNWFGVSLVFMLALILCYAKIKTRALTLPIAVHMLNNAVALALYAPS